MKQMIKCIPIVGSITRYIYLKWLNPPPEFRDSESYWNKRYKSGRNSGDGSYSQLAEFKADVLNEFVREHQISSVIEYGCGDGNQLRLAKYPSYIGFDVSPVAISLCSNSFSFDSTKAFKLVGDYCGEMAELTLSLDVIYHLIEDNVFNFHMERLFDSSKKFVIIYSSDTSDNLENTVPHVRHRQFTKWVQVNRNGWSLLKVIPNRYPFDGDYTKSSLANFYVYSR
jgi:hypothetical protein